jgi:tRNA/tmRNA/rRNA uracil-C5-methylase (TrmA/RlmC/RlmD family)
MLKRKDVAECVIERVDYPNCGRYKTEEGQKLTVKNTLPGQRIRCRIFKKHQDRVEGRLFEIVEKSPLETREKVCDNFPLCGGCLCQTMPYEDQLAMKEDMVRRLLDEVVDDAVYDGILRSPLEFEYRNKMEFSFGDDVENGPLTLGLHRRNTTYTVLNAHSCALAHEDVRKVLGATLDYCREMGLKKYDKKIHKGFLRFLLVRRSQTTGELLVYIVTSSQQEHDFSDWADRLLALPIEGSYAGIFHAIDDKMSDAVKVDYATPLYGKEYFYEELLGLKFKVTAFSFFQTNTPGAEVLYDAVRRYVTGGVPGQNTPGQEDGGDRSSKAEKVCVDENRSGSPVLYDLYSGTGTIGQVLSPVAGKVYGIELIPEAVDAARENVALNGITNCEFIAGDVLEKLAELPEKPDYIVLDPPREGINPKALAQIIDYGVGEMVYISCKASSFKRDMVTLRASGWRVKRYCLVDLFPQTMHVETVCLLSKLSEAKNHISVKVDMDEMDVTAAESKATYQEIQEWVQEKYRFHVTHLNIAKTKRKCGIIERVNYNLPKSENSRSPETPKEKEEAIIEAFRHFQMI